MTVLKIITCFKHGDFEQRPNDHLRGKGCISAGLCKKTQNNY